MDFSRLLRPAAPVALACAALLQSTAAVAASCSVFETALETGLVETVTMRLKAPFSSERCASLNAAVAAWDAKVKRSRALGTGPALDRAGAEVELTRAARDPEFGAALRRELAGEKDPVRQLVVEAGLLHHHGLLKARDLMLSRAAAATE